MLVDTDNLVTSDDFQHNFEKFAKAVKKGRGPFAVMENGEVIGCFVAPDYCDFSGNSIRVLLSSRMEGPTISQKKAEKYVVAKMEKRQKKRDRK